jgi:hypothetical protein
MTTTCVAADDNWENRVFSETEIKELQAVTEEVLAEYETVPDQILTGAISVPMNQVAEILGLIWKSYMAESEPYSNFIYSIGTALAVAYLYDSEIEFDETISEAATYFIELVEEEDEEDEEDVDDGDGMVDED